MFSRQIWLSRLDTLNTVRINENLLYIYSEPSYSHSKVFN